MYEVGSLNDSRWKRGHCLSFLLSLGDGDEGLLECQGPGGGRAKGMAAFIVRPGHLGTKEGGTPRPAPPSGPVKTVSAVLTCHSESSIGCGGWYRQPPKLSQGNSITQGTAALIFWLNALWATITSFCPVLVQRHDSVLQASGNPPLRVCPNSREITGDWRRCLCIWYAGYLSF